MRVSISKPLAIYEIGGRPNQEDSIYPKYGDASEDNKVFVLCDGMGGHEKGEAASSLVCSEMSKYIYENWDESGFTDSILFGAVNTVLDKLEVLNDNTDRRPGTTLTLLVFHKGGVLAAHIGDSRIYHIRPSEKRILYKSRDHSLVYDMLASGEISISEMRNYKKKNVITRALIPGQESRPKPAAVHITDLKEGDYFFMCSDGMLEQMNDEELVECFCDNIEDEKKQEGLIKRTSENKDNHSAYIIKITNVELEEGDDQLKNDESSSPCNALLLEQQATTDVYSVKKSSRKLFSNILLVKYVLFILLFVVLLLFILKLVF